MSVSAGFRWSFIDTFVYDNYALFEVWFIFSLISNDILYSVLHFYECFARCTFMHLYICIIAPHLATIDEPREWRDIGIEHEDDVWWTYPEEAKNQEYMLGPEYSPSECHLTNTDLVLIPGKPRCMSYYFKLCFTIYMFYLLLVHYVLGIDWNPRCMILRFPRIFTSMSRSIVVPG